jgi:hypothetical protein
VRTYLSVLVLVGPSLFCSLPLQGQSSRGTTLVLTVAPECSIGIVSVAPGGPNSQIVTFNYKLRTADSGGQGQIMLRFTASGTGNLPNGGTLDYQTSLAGPGTPSSGTAAFPDALNSGIVIARFGQQAHSTRAGAVGTVQFTTSDSLRPALSISCR